MITMLSVVRPHLRGMNLLPTLAVLAALVMVGLGLSAGLSGCFPTAKKGFDSPDNALRIDASVHAAESGDVKAVPDLVRLLDSDDPATRLVAVRSLEKITGTTLGYDHAGNASDREAGVQRWQGWIKDGLKPRAFGADAKSSPSQGPGMANLVPANTVLANPQKEAAK